MIASWPKTTTFPVATDGRRGCVFGAAIIAVTIIAAMSVSKRKTRLGIDPPRGAAQQNVQKRVDDDERDADRDLPDDRRVSNRSAGEANHGANDPDPIRRV